MRAVVSPIPTAAAGETARGARRPPAAAPAAAPAALRAVCKPAAVAACRSSMPQRTSPRIRACSPKRDGSIARAVCAPATLTIACWSARECSARCHHRMPRPAPIPTAGATTASHCPRNATALLRASASTKAFVTAKTKGAVSGCTAPIREAIRVGSLFRPRDHVKAALRLHHVTELSGIQSERGICEGGVQLGLRNTP